MCPPENGKNKNTSLCWTDLLGTIKKTKNDHFFFPRETSPHSQFLRPPIDEFFFPQEYFGWPTI